jgi:hypothetical protein
MSDTIAFGCGVVSVIHAGKPIQSCRIGWRRPGITAYGADSDPVSGSVPVTPPSKLQRTAKVRTAYPIHPPCAGGHSGDC